MGNIIKKTAELTADKDGVGCAKLVIFANAPEDNPLWPGPFTELVNPNALSMWV